MSVPQPKLKPKSKPSARRRVYEYLQQRIVSGAIARGSALSELQISRDLRVSRTPVREAIGQLVAEGIVEQLPNRSSIVVDLSRNDIVDLYEVREALETFAVRKVSERHLQPASAEELKRTLTQLDDVRQRLLQSGRERLDATEQSGFMVLDLRLHAHLVLSTQNARMQKIVNDTRVLVRIFSMRRQGHTLDALEQIHRHHCDIVDAVIRQDGTRASELLSEHIRHSLKERLDEFDIYTRERLMQQHRAAFEIAYEAEALLGSGT